MLTSKTIGKCAECGSMWDTTICMRSRKSLCRSCCDTDCSERFSCWGRYF